MKIFIFGDSFFDDKHNSNETWMGMLKKLYTVENFSRSGTGPHYNLPLIVDMILKNRITSKDVIICHISGTNRVNFPINDDKTTNEIYWDHKTKKSFTYSGKQKDESIKNIQNFYNTFQHEIDFAYLTFDKFLQISGHLMTGYLHSISNKKNIKVLLFGNTNNGNGKREMQVVPFEDKNFHLSKFDLFEVSDNEIFLNEVDNWDYLYGLHDTRNNHLSVENHEIFFKYISEFISNNFIDHKVKFKKNFRHLNDVFVSNFKQNQIKEKFIYQ